MLRAAQEGPAIGLARAILDNFRTICSIRSPRPARLSPNLVEFVEFLVELVEFLVEYLNFSFNFAECG